MSDENARGVTLEPGGSMTDAIQSVRDAGGWQDVMRSLGQDPDQLFREILGAIFYSGGTIPTMFEFWLCGFLAGLAASQQAGTIIHATED